MDKSTILIVDDSEMNRALLNDMLIEQFNILEAKDGYEALSILMDGKEEISLILLDMVMPKMDGFAFLNAISSDEIIKNTPIIMISSETDSSLIEKAFDMGVVDFISRPFSESIVLKRVNNIMKLYAKEKKLFDIICDQIYENEKSNRVMTHILAEVVETRNGESGRHCLAISEITNILLNKLITKTDKYSLTDKDILTICTASSFHDIGKMIIPEKILNKPGKFNESEYEIMKTHTTEGLKILNNLSAYHDEEIVRVAKEICAYHHERFDGKGYPNNLKGDDIPISAQIVSIADVYDALTNERCYKEAYTHEKSLEMIFNGECGTFNPLLLECLDECSEEIRARLQSNIIDDKKLATEKIALDLKNNKLYNAQKKA